jgi:hypothetical protein
VLIEKKIKNQEFIDNFLANHWEKEKQKKRSHTPSDTDTEAKE